MFVFFLIVLVITVLLYFLSRKKYNDYIEPLDGREYRLKNIMSIGFIILDKFKYGYGTKYDRNLQTKIVELKGHKYSLYYLQVHWANKITFIFVMVLFLSLLGAAVGSFDPAYIVFGVIVVGAVAYFMDNELNEKINKRRLSIQLDFPDFLNKLVLLVNAGMTVPMAWEKIVTDNKKQTVLYNELATVLADVRGGKSETSAYEDFARRCRIPEITKFISVILQNAKKGNTELVSILRLQASECWEMRKHAAKRLGEEASAKILFPMMLMFFAVILIVATPAVLAMRGI